MPDQIKPEDVRVGDTIRVTTEYGKTLVHAEGPVTARGEDEGIDDGTALLAGYGWAQIDGNRTITLLDRPEPPKTPGQVLWEFRTARVHGGAHWTGVGDLTRTRHEDEAAAVIAQYEATKPKPLGNSRAVREVVRLLVGSKVAGQIGDIGYQRIADAAVTP